MVVYDAGAGEIRTHYAGFFDPGFGLGSSYQHQTLTLSKHFRR